MPDFVDDLVTLATKSNLRAVPASGNSANYFTAADYQAIVDALTSLRTHHLNRKVFNIRDYGAVGDGITNDTAAIQAAIDAAGAVRGTVFIPPTTTAYRFSNLKLPAYITVQGAHMQFSCLERIPGSTGTAIREKTVAEGNADGATGIWLCDFAVYGSSTTGDGIDIGNQTVGKNFSTFNGVSHVLVKNFVGTGWKINSNASPFFHLYANGCTNGVHFAGAACTANIIHSLFSEGNTTSDLIVADVGSKFFGLQLESSGTAPVVISGSDALLAGVYIGIFVNMTDVVVISGVRNVLRDVTCVLNGHTISNLVKDTSSGSTVGTGSVISRISTYVTPEDASVQGYPGPIVLRSETQARERLRLAGQEYYQAGNSSDDGIALLLGLQRTGNRSLWFADSAQLASNATNALLQMGILASGLGASFDVTATNISTPLPLALQSSGGRTNVGGALAVSGNVAFNGATPAAKPTITGSRGGNAALASLLTALAAIGLITDGTTA